MTEKDLTEKYLESFQDVFADILNVLLFRKIVIKEEELAEGPTESTYKAENKELRGQYRDTSKFYKNSKCILAVMGIENQSVIDKDMPIRVMGYDYGTYRAQIDGKDNRRFPVITCILNFSDTEWKTPLSLCEMLDIPENLKGYISDYKINVFNISFLPKETRDMFQSDFKVVADFFTERRLGIYRPENHKEEIKHVEAVLNLLQVFTNDETYDKIEERILETARKGEVITMCSFAEEMTNRGIEQGIEQGMAQGIAIGEKNGIIKYLFAKGADEETISREAEVSIETVIHVLKEAGLKEN